MAGVAGDPVFMYCPRCWRIYVEPLRVAGTATCGWCRPPDLRVQPLALVRDQEPYAAAYALGGYSAVKGLVRQVQDRRQPQDG